MQSGEFREGVDDSAIMQSFAGVFHEDIFQVTDVVPHVAK